ncbi:hypothetical protein M2387_000453 [Klebsiella sp. BIGb0407]|nr:hypothetical protein [Klebsiella sp. BIGb0407]
MKIKLLNQKVGRHGSLHRYSRCANSIVQRAGGLIVFMMSFTTGRCKPLANLGGREKWRMKSLMEFESQCFVASMQDALSFSHLII